MRSEPMFYISKAGMPTGHILRAIIVCGVVAGSALVSPVAGRAQTATLSQVVPEQPRTLVLSPVHALPAVRYARYSPVLCGVVSPRVMYFAYSDRVLTWRERWRESPATFQSDSIYNAATTQASINEVRACLASATVANTPPRQLWSLGNALLDVHEDARAAEAFARVLQQNRTAPVTEQAWWLSQLFTAYLGEDSARVRTAFTYLAQLDALGAPAAGFRLKAHNEIYGYASARDSIAFMTDQARRARQLSRTLTGEMQREWLGEILAAVANQADVEQRRKQYQPAIAEVKAAIKELEPLNAALVHQTLDPVLQKLQVIAGNAAMPKTQAAYVYFPGQQTHETTIVRPRPGRVAVFITGSYQWGGFSESPGFVMFRFAQRVADRFGDRVDVTILGEAIGMDGERLIPVADEAPLFPKFFHDYMKMTVPVVVFTPKVTGKAPDGRLIREPNPNSFAMATLVDKHGAVRDFQNALPGLRWMNMIEEMLQEP
jgi:hypothetical protein